MPCHFMQIYDKYGIGFGILSLQAKESKHAGLKGELSMTNQSWASDHKGKWWQLMRSNYIRTFYLHHTLSPANLLIVIHQCIVIVGERKWT